MASQVADNLKNVSELVDAAASSDASAKDIRATITSLQDTVNEYEKTISDETYKFINKSIKASENSLKKFLTADCMAKTFGKDKQALIQARVDLQEGQSAIYSQIMGGCIDEHKTLTAKCEEYEAKIKAEEDKKASMQASLNGEMTTLKSQLAQAFAGSSQRETEKKQLSETHAKEITQLREAHSKALNDAQASHDSATTALKNSHQSALESLKGDHDQALSNQKKEAEAALAATTKSFEGKLAEKDAVIANLQKEKDEQATSHAATLKNASDEAEKAKSAAVADAEKAKEAALADAKKASDKTIADVKAELDAANKKIKELEAELEKAKADSE
mmetsp:Transcript_39308/g.44745  ORF Transcript_39308/g.44745 Transcript_39308/m.44745 type:complete len:334 (-) Transcript_39308:1809-2810(-)